MYSDGSACMACGIMSSQARSHMRNASCAKHEYGYDQAYRRFLWGLEPIRQHCRLEGILKDGLRLGGVFTLHTATLLNCWEEGGQGILGGSSGLQTPCQT